MKKTIFRIAAWALLGFSPGGLAADWDRVDVYHHYSMGGGEAGPANTLCRFGGGFNLGSTGPLSPSVMLGGVPKEKVAADSQLDPGGLFLNLQFAGHRKEGNIGVLLFDAMVQSQELKVGGQKFGHLTNWGLFAGAEVGPDKQGFFNPFLQAGIGFRHGWYAQPASVTEVAEGGTLVSFAYMAAAGVDMYLSKSFGLNLTAHYYPFSGTVGMPTSERDFYGNRLKKDYPADLVFSPLVFSAALVFYN